MSQISFGKKTAFVASEASRQETSGMDIAHLGSKGAIYMQGTVMVADKLYKTGIGVALPDDPVYIQKLQDELETLKQYLTARHVR